MYYNDQFSKAQQAGLVSFLPRGPIGRAGRAGGGSGAAPGWAVVGDLGVLVHAAADAVADQASDDAEAAGLDDLLDGVAHVPEPLALAALLDGGLEPEVAGLDQVGGLLGRLA